MKGRSANSLFNQEQELAIIHAYANGENVVSLASGHNCSKNIIYRILDGAGAIRQPTQKKLPLSCTWECQIPPTPFPECRFQGIYKFTNRVNGKVYIGQSYNMHLRYKEHRKSAGSSLSAAIKKYGIDSFNFEVLERIEDRTKVSEREQYWIDYYQSYKSSKGYNRAKLVNNIGLGCKRSAATKLAIGIRTRERQAKFGHPCLGRKASDEERKRISEARKRNPFSKELLDKISAIRVQKMTKRVAQIDIETSHIIRVWESVTAIQKSLSIPASCIRNACRGFASNINGRYPKTSHAGYRWEYTDLEPTIYDEGHVIKIKGRSKEIAQIDPNTGKTLRIWGNANKVAQELGFPAESIKNACRGYYVNSSGRHPKPMHGGFRWRFLSEKGKLVEPSLKNSALVTPTRGKRIAQIDLISGEVLQVWVNSKEIKQELGYCRESINMSCRGSAWSSKLKAHTPKVSHYNFGWRYISDTGEIIEPNLKGIKLINPTRPRKIAQLELITGKILRIWANAVEVSRELGCHSDSILNACHGKCYNTRRKAWVPKLSFGGFKWHYISDDGVLLPPDTALSDTYKHGVIKQIAQIDQNTGETIRIWESAKKIQEEMGLKSSSIGAACRGKYWCSVTKAYRPKTTHGGFKWQYVE